MPNSVKLVYGAAAFGGGALSEGQKAPGTFDYSTDEGVAEVLKVLKDVDVPNLDTAQIYGQSEVFLGRQPSRKDFTIDTKIGGGFNPGHLDKESILHLADDGIRQKLQLDSVDIYYIHAPEPSADLASTLAGIDAAHKQGLFRRFGLSNYTAAMVEEVYNLAKDKGYVLPTVYQGNYNAVARKQDDILFPTLRKLGISFYAYSPIAGGFLTKTREDLARDGGAGRFIKGTQLGDMYLALYGKKSYLDALGKWGDAAEAEGVSKAELAYRWVAWHSALDAAKGDAVVFGAKSEQQIRQTVAGIRKGPLSAEAVKAIDEVWETIKHEAPIDNYQVMAKK